MKTNVKKRKFVERIIKRAGDEQGQTMVVVALFMVVLLSFTALSVDTGLAYYQRSKLQTAIDAAVLAAVYDLPNTEKAKNTAIDYIEKNGFTEDDVKIEFNEAVSEIKITKSAEMETVFANIFNTKKVVNNAVAAAKLEDRSFLGAFDYRIFQGSDNPADVLTLGARYDIDGSVHSNSNIYSNPASGGGHITGNFQAAGKVTINQGNIPTLGGVSEGVSKIEMPDFASAVDAIVPKSWDFVGTINEFYTYLKNTKGVNSWDNSIPVDGNVKIIGDMNVGNWVINGNLYIEGNATLGWAKVTLNGGSIYATGSLKFNNSFYGCGCVFSKGDLVFNGGMSQIDVSNSTVTIYSETGNITMSAAATEMYGIVYAPNGNVNIAGNTLAYYGSIVAKKVTGIPANLIMRENPHDLPFSFSKKIAALIE